MKKLLFCISVITLTITACKKKVNDPSITVTASAPTITVNGGIYYSINTGGVLPTISATAYDTFYNEVCSVVTDQTGLDNTTPGLYAVTLSAKNKYGMIGYATVYVGVTNISDSLNLAGTYIRTVSPPNPNRVATITKVGRGLFLTSNVAGVDITDPTTGIIASAVFVVTSDSTIDFGSQLTAAAGTLSATTDMLSLAPGDTTLSYAVINTNFGTQVRTFVKQ